MKYTVFILSSFFLLLAFQNCNPAGFSASSQLGESNQASNSGENNPAEIPITPPPEIPPTDLSPSLSAKIQAATQTAAINSFCQDLGDFYWEIGDANGTLASGKIGTTYDASTSIGIASASKIVFGAYMAERTAGFFSPLQKQALRMLSGYGGLNPAACAASPTVGACLTVGNPGPNYDYVSANVDKFDYDGAHDQYYASLSEVEGGLGWATSTTAELNIEIMNKLGNPGFRYGFPQFAGGVTSSAAQFAAFLKNIVAKKLLIYNFLGSDPVCTLPSVCASAVGSPAPVAWHYSYNHWVEDDASGDGAFSSPGAFGFYPWISKDKTLYGIISRNSKAVGKNGGPYWQSVLCGQKIRSAWLKGIPQ